MDLAEIQRRIAVSLELLRKNDSNGTIGVIRPLVEAHPAEPMGQLVLGVALGRLGLPAAVAHLKQAVKLDPGDAQCHYNYAVTLADQGNESLAMVEYEKCLALAPNHVDAIWNYGEMLRLREHFSLALSLFERLKEIEGGLRPKIGHRMAVCCAHIEGLEDKAAQLFEDELSRYNDPHTHWEYALFLLSQGRLVEAWPHYERRFDAGPRIRLMQWPQLYEKWKGQFEPGTLVVMGEQGAGDEILFAAYLPKLLEQALEGGLNVIIAGRQSLRRLFQASFQDIDYIAYDVAEKYDVIKDIMKVAKGRIWQIPYGDLPLYVCKQFFKSYLIPHPDDIAFLERELAPVINDQPNLRVGLVLQSNPKSSEANRRARDVNARLFNEYAKNLQGVSFFSLAPEDHLPILAQMPDLHVRDMSGYLADFSRTAALMRAMDVVVSVCTSTANLSAALGCNTQVLLKYHFDWRWCPAGNWYSSVSTYRQSLWGDWSEAICNVIAVLDNMAKNKISMNTPKVV